MDVGIRELKQHLSAYLDRVDRGETLRVTDRGRPKAIISPVVGGDPLARGVDEGWVRPPVRPGGLAQVTPVAGRQRVLDALDDDRSDG